MIACIGAIIFGTSVSHAAYIAPPSTIGEAVVLIDADTKEILFAKNPDKWMHPASTTKMVTLLTALELKGTQLDELATRLEAQGFRPYVIPVGGSNALGALGYVESALEIAQQCEGAVSLSSVVVASGSAGTHAGLAVGLEQLLPDVELIGVTVSRSVADQKPKVVTLQQAGAEQLALKATADIQLWDDYFAPGYGTPNEEGMDAVKLLARLEGILLDPVYTGKAMAGLIDGIEQKRFKDEGPILFVHTGGAPALFAYHPHV